MRLKCTACFCMFRHCCLSRRRGESRRASCSAPSPTDQPLNADAMYSEGGRLRVTPPFHGRLVFFGARGGPRMRVIYTWFDSLLFFVIVSHDSGTHTVSVTPHPSARSPPSRHTTSKCCDCSDRRPAFRRTALPRWLPRRK